MFILWFIYPPPPNHCLYFFSMCTCVDLFKLVLQYSQFIAKTYTCIALYECMQIKK